MTRFVGTAGQAGIWAGKGDGLIPETRGVFAPIAGARVYFLRSLCQWRPSLPTGSVGSYEGPS